MKKIYLLVILILISGCSMTGQPVIDVYVPPEEIGEIGVYFCPSKECETRLIDFVDEADRINCAFYDLDLNNLIDALDKKSKTNEVNVLVDNDNFDKVKQYDFIRKDDSKQLSHNKFCIFYVGDKKIITTGSHNPTEKGTYSNNNNRIFIESEYLARNYQDEFDELWSGVFSNGKGVKYYKVIHNNFTIENYFCPEDACEDEVLNVIEEAKNNIYFMTFDFTSDYIGDLIIEKYKQGVDVRGIFEKFRNSQYSEYRKMEAAKMDVRLDSSSDFLHHKVFIVDDVVILGSYNPTSSGNNKNDENILIIHNKEIANQFIEEFNRLWRL